MKRLCVLICCAVLVTATAMAQGLQERPLGDAAQPTTTVTPSAQVTPVQPQAGAPVQPQAGAPVQPQTGAAAQPAPQPGVQPTPQPGGQPAPPPDVQAPPSEAAAPPHPKSSKQRKYSKEEVHQEVMGFFDGGSAGLAELVAKAFKDMGQPTGYIKGSEAGGALLVGLRYGTGYLYLKNHKPIEVFWQSPSVGIDIGLNAVRVFTLVYGMDRPEEIFQRFPGVDGSAYFIGGFGMNYQTSKGLVLAPIRFGVGLRLGANVGYQHYTRTQEINPF
ncbi:MAG: EipA family protein [Desulfovibrionaceae bacterium]|nr:EipA family protein [Desulfovibrionaceae bacterium]